MYNALQQDREYCKSSLSKLTKFIRKTDPIVKREKNKYSNIFGQLEYVLRQGRFFFPSMY